jgi:hypothetical protein
MTSHGEYVHEKLLHIQTGNGYVSRFKKWRHHSMALRLNGVAAKYPPNDLGWRRALEKSAAPITAEHCLLAAIG